MVYWKILAITPLIYWKILEDIGRYWKILEDIGRYWKILEMEDPQSCDILCSPARSTCQKQMWKDKDHFWVKIPCAEWKGGRSVFCRSLF